MAGVASLLGRVSLGAIADVPLPALVPAVPANRPLRVLILGGTGFIGPHQVRYAVERGHRVTLFNRRRRAAELPAGVEELIGDRDAGDLGSLAGREWDVCIDNPTTLPSWVRDVGRVLAGKLRHYVFISTVSVYANPARGGVDELAPVARYAGADAMVESSATLRANGALYGALKAICETEAEKHFPGGTTIIRPTLIAGPGDETDRFTYWPVRIARGGEVLAPPAADPVQVIDVRDLAEWTIRVAEQRTLGVFNAAGPVQELRVGAMLEEIRVAVKSSARVTTVDADFLTAQGVAMWSDLPAWASSASEMAGFARIDSARAVRAGLTFRPLAETAADTLAWFNAQPEARRAKLRAGLSAERDAGAGGVARVARVSRPVFGIVRVQMLSQR